MSVLGTNYLEENRVTDVMQMEPSVVRKPVFISVSSPTRSSPWQAFLPESLSKLGRSLTSGNMEIVTKAICNNDSLFPIVFKSIIGKIQQECTSLCRRSHPTSFRRCDVEDIGNFDWEKYCHKLQEKAPLLWQLLLSIATFNDHRAKGKAEDSHFSRIVVAAAIILKERSREMIGVQSMLSLLLFHSRVDKVVSHSLKYLLYI